MKKYFIIAIGIALLLASCTKQNVNLPSIYQNPYRTIIEYEPSTFTLEFPGKLTPDAQYDWISMSQSGNQATFTVRRNTWDAIRRAEFSIEGCSDKAVISQKSHKLDANLSISVKNQSAKSLDINCTLSTDYYDDYEGWGLIYSESTDITKGTEVPQTGNLANGEATVGSIPGLDVNTDYYVWAYVTSTEGNRPDESDMLVVMPPVFVNAGEDLQAALDGAREYQTVKVIGGATFAGPIYFNDNNKNKSISGGWNADFSEQSMDNLTVIDGGGVSRGFHAAANIDADSPLEGYANISYFEITNCFCSKGHGSAVKISGGPVTVDHCYMHHNKTDRGTIDSHEDGTSSEFYVYNCIITHNVSTGDAPGVAIEDGKDYVDRTKGVFVNNLIANNTTTKAKKNAIYVYNKIEAIFINNTIVSNSCMENTAEPHDNIGIYMRGNGLNMWANNVFVGQSYYDKTDNTIFYRNYSKNITWATKGTFVNGVVEGGNISANFVTDGNIEYPYGFDLKTIFKDPDNEDYTPIGDLVGAGTLGTYSYTSAKGEDMSATVKTYLQKFPDDLAGNPRIVNGKVDMGCYQSK